MTRSAEPLLSVIIPFYNSGGTLERCLQSVYSQTYRNIEIVLVNDGSPEKPVFEPKDNLRYIEHEVNRGLFQTRITGFEASKGEYVAFLDSDDFVSPDFYRSLIHASMEQDLDIAAGDTVFDDNGVCTVKNLHEANFGNVKLVGDDVKRSFFGQQGSSYVWHTIWNKVYRRSLWEKCLPVYKEVTEKVGMLEDVLFSSVLFHKAGSFRYIHNEGYHYCTNSASITGDRKDDTKFLNNVVSICTVFDKVQDYLESENECKGILDDLTEFRRLYSRMWRNSLVHDHSESADRKRLTAAVDRIMPGYSELYSPSDHYFEEFRTPYDPTTENIKNLIMKADVVSFDIFDTLVLRPFMVPDDLFMAMGCDYAFGNVPFAKIRTLSESDLRSKWYRVGKGTEDFTLSDIYRHMSEMTGIPMDLLDSIKEKEVDAEVRYCRPRSLVVELFRLAKYLGKKVFLTSDMYLEKAHVERILGSCGIVGYDRLLLSSDIGHTKYTGNLFKDLISQSGADPKAIVHIGDDWNKDFTNARSKGIIAIYMPKGTDVFKGVVQNVKTNNLGRLPEMVVNPFVDGSRLTGSFGFRCMLKTVSDRLFGHPYPSYNADSDFNASAEAVGYYPVGMHLVGISAWLDRKVRESGAVKVVFLSRDGYLPKKAFDLYAGGSVTTEYVACSRMALMPFLVDVPVDLLELPLEFRAHSGRSLMELLDFCMDADGESFSEEKFEDKESYLDFITKVAMKHYSKEKHYRSRGLVEGYYRSHIPEGSLVFDMGYSGKLAFALRKALGYDVRFMYVYKNSSADVYIDRFGLMIDAMYPFEPSMSGFLREYLLSEPDNRCTGFEEEGSEVVPVLVGGKRNRLESYAVDSVQRYALEFVEDYLRTFKDVPLAFRFDPVPVSLPFESMLVNMKDFDRRLFADSYEDDTVYGGKDRVSVYDLWTGEISRRPAAVGTVVNAPAPVRNKDPFESVFFNRTYYKAMAFGRLMKRKFRI